MAEVIQLFGTPAEDTVIPCEPMPGVRFHIAYVVGVGQCPHQHRLEQKAEACRDRMRHYIEEQERTLTSGWQPDGTLVVRRRGPGRRPQRRPW